MCHLQELYAKYCDKGLVVLGFDCCDDKKIALEMLRDNKVTFPNVIDASKPAEKVCFEQYQHYSRSAVPMSYLIGPDGKVVDAWYGYDEGEPKAVAALQKAGGELAEAVRRDADAKVAKSAREVTAAAKRLFKAIQGADYSRDWTAGGQWSDFPAKDAPYHCYRDHPGWVRWICKNFKANGIADVRLGKVVAGTDGLPTVHYELRLKDGKVLKGDLPFSWDAEEKHWIGHQALDWHLGRTP
jgi:hypothetical protein